MKLTQAQRKQSKLRLNLSGASGSGKTLSALLVAAGVVGKRWERIAVIDTEQGSAQLYAGNTTFGVGSFNVLSLDEPYSPQRYIEAIDICNTESGIECIIIDSASHEWDGPGGCLEIHTRLGGRFEHWAKVTPEHRRFIDAILTSPKHVITTTRKKTDYAMEQNDKGKVQPRKVGLKDVQREGWEYELTTAFELNSDHFATVSKDRTGLFYSAYPLQLDMAVGEKLADWLKGDAEDEDKETGDVERSLPAGLISGQIERFSLRPTKTQLEELAAKARRLPWAGDLKAYFSKFIQKPSAEWDLADFQKVSAHVEKELKTALSQTHELKLDSKGESSQ